MTRFVVKGSDGGDRIIEIHKATGGAHAGKLYLKCSCVGGRFAWKGGEYRPCRHVREVVDALHLNLQEGHLARLPKVRSIAGVMVVA